MSQPTRDVAETMRRDGRAPRRLLIRLTLGEAMIGISILAVLFALIVRPVVLLVVVFAVHTLGLAICVIWDVTQEWKHRPTSLARILGKGCRRLILVNWLATAFIPFLTSTHGPILPSAWLWRLEVALLVIAVGVFGLWVYAAVVEHLRSRRGASPIDHDADQPGSGAT